MALFALSHNSRLQVDDPSKYGVVVMDDSGLVDRFVEKPKVSMLHVVYGIHYSCPLSESSIMHIV